MSYLLDSLPISSSAGSSGEPARAPAPRAGRRRRSSNKTRRLPTSTSESALSLEAYVTKLTFEDVETLPKTNNKIKPFILKSTTSSSTTTTLASIGSSPRCDQPKSRAASKPQASLDGRIETATTNLPVTIKVRSSNGNKGKTPGRPFFVPADPFATSSNPIPSKPPRKRSTSTASHASAKATLQAIDTKRPPVPSLHRSSCNISMHDLVASISDLKSIAATIDTPMTSTDENSGPTPTAAYHESFAHVSSAVVKVVSSPSRLRSRTQPMRRPLSVQALSSTPLRSSPKPIRRVAHDDDLTYSINSLRGPAKSMTYDNVSRSTSRDKKPSRRREMPIALGFAGEPMEYRSMQELLEASGFKDTRVVTPVSKPKQANQIPDSSLGMPIPGPFPFSTSHLQGNNTSSTLVEGLLAPSSQYFSSPSSLHPPLSKGHKLSMLSLRGLFSLWKAEDEAIPSTSPQAHPEDRIPRQGAHSNAADSIEEADLIQHCEHSTLFIERKAQFLLKTQAWVDEVAREAAALSISPAMLRASLQPKSFASIVAQEEKEEQGRGIEALHALGSDLEIRKGSLMSSRHEGLVMSPSSNHYQSFGVAALGMEGAEARNQWLDIEAQLRDATTFEDEDLAFVGDHLPRLQYDDVVSERDGESTHHTPRRPRQIAQVCPVPLGSNPTEPPTSLWATLRTKASNAMLSLYTPAAPPLPEGGKAAEEARRSGAPKAIRKAVSTSALKPVLSTGMCLEGFDKGFDWDRARRSIQAVQRGP
ncbi:BZ3500_MvSof-1268-A1-R1_Chr4-1g06823 [Microbotryum saponariae]|uniref:BZ3500_MvSof-1268-A1-R1_Chr4-1g06823 protein n=1 Tax=Microbotryum saponariae TaxID=289078 RepID=A0A2X0LMF8_9BASI|nr:BZ3500_MvSof-1268-A1-R1_Chr4-1g06823 [Microbotryum saponariae]SDA06480.1 BZ3501_MvSof-1269-A2-R1_Chr4-1g06525 [Microbotryum saponariae]